MGPLVEKALAVIPLGDRQKDVADFVDGHGGWNWDELTYLFTDSVCLKIAVKTALST